MKKIKLNVLLGKTDHLASSFSASLKNYSKFFKGSQGAFQGEKRTYQPKEGIVDEPSKRGTTLIQTTVGEKLAYMIQGSEDYLNSLFAVEATNASGNAKAELIVEGESWGEFTSLELLRLKSFIENSDLRNMLENIPVRSDAQIWEDCTSEDYTGRQGIVQTEMLKGEEKTTVKESFVMEDPNIKHLKEGGQYTPQIANKNTVVSLGDYTQQKFSGEWTQRQKANALKKRSELLSAVIVALKECNEVEVVESTLSASKVFGYLLG